MPVEDVQQDWNLIVLSWDETFTTLEFSRDLDTGDAADIVISVSLYKDLYQYQVRETNI